MSVGLKLPTSTVEEQEQEDFFFIPSFALCATNGEPMTGYKLAYPVNGLFHVSFDADFYALIDSAYFRFSEQVGSRRIWFRENSVRPMQPGDILRIIYTP